MTVNEKPPEHSESRLSSRAGVLAVLRRQAGAAVSGNVIAGEIGVSRVAVWKAVQSLQELGYPILQIRRGYQLEAEDGADFLYPWEFGERETNFRHWQATGSTMDRARELAERGSPGGMVVTAETQSAGRGRNGRAWASGPGGLFFSLLERPRVPLADYSGTVMAVHIAVGRALSGVCGQRAALRWPNDVYLQEKKAAGILTEVHGEGDRVQWLTSGIGVNINNTVAVENSVSCAAIAGRRLSRRAVLERILQELGEIKKLAAEESPRLISRLWNQEAEGIGRRVSARGGRTAGVFLGVDARGRAMIKTGSRIKRLPPGAGSLRF